MELEERKRRQWMITDLISLPLTLAFMVLGVGTLIGALFEGNQLLNGPWRLGIGLLFSVYGLIRSSMIVRRLMNSQKRW
jgi:ABC-type molybdate transport system permease subunit